MPLLDMKCASCGKPFEYLKRGPGDDPVCPSCGSSEVRRLLSVFAVGAAGRATPPESACGGDPASCGRCSPDGCWN